MRALHLEGRASSRPGLAFVHPASRLAVLVVLSALAPLACGPTGSRAISEPVDLGRDGGDKKDMRFFDGPGANTPTEPPPNPGPGEPDGGASTNQDAASITPAPDGPGAAVDAPPTATGAACSSGEQCATGQCVDGVCCASACQMPCYACDVEGAPGQCLPVPDNRDPGNDCTPEPVGTCGRDGFCDGKGACRRYPAGTECVPGSCSGAMEYAGRACDGNGTCSPGTNKSCAPNVCMGSSCASRCTTSAQCQAGFFCDAGACRGKRPAGQACQTPGECSSNICADGVCCGTACDMPCHACNLTGTVGTCTPVPAGADPGNDCPNDPVDGCQRDGTCNGRGGCRLYTANVQCVAKACSNGTESGPRLCNGLGVCGAPITSKACGNFVCGADVCKTSCTTVADCKAGLICRNNNCLASGLVLHWRFDEPDGATNAEDSSGNNLRGTFTGVTGTPVRSTEVPPVKFANPSSRAFVGDSRQAVLLAGMPMSLKPTTELTIAAWYRTNKLDPAPTIDASEVVSGGNNYLLRVRATDIEVSKRVGGSPGWVRCFGVVMNHFDNTWHHIATVVDATTVKVYFDGVQKCMLANTAPMIYDKGNDFVVGRHGENELNFDFDGNIDDVRFYSRALPQPEIAALAGGED